MSTLILDEPVTQDIELPDLTLCILFLIINHLSTLIAQQYGRRMSRRHSSAISVIITTNLYFDNTLGVQTSITLFITLLLYNNTSSRNRGYQERTLCATIKILERKEKILE